MKTPLSLIIPVLLLLIALTPLMADENTALQTNLTVPPNVDVFNVLTSSSENHEVPFYVRPPSS